MKKTLKAIFTTLILALAVPGHGFAVGSAPTLATAASASASSARPAATLRVSNVKATNATADSVAITWQTSVPATSAVKYGLTDNYGQTAQDSSLVVSHKMILGASAVTRGTTYYFAVTSNTANNSATQAGQQFSTPGFVVAIQVTDKSGSPLRGAQATLGGHTVTTDKNGNAIFANVPAGSQQVTIRSGSKTTVLTIKVGVMNPKTHTYAPQEFKLAADTDTSLLTILATVVFAAVLILGSLSIAPFHIPGINPMRHHSDA